MYASPLLARSLRRPLPLAAAFLTVLCLTAPALAQVESYMLKRGGKVGPESQIKPTNCVTGPDGSITCDTVIENPPSDTPAQPQYQPFRN